MLNSVLEAGGLAVVGSGLGGLAWVRLAQGACLGLPWLLALEFRVSTKTLLGFSSR